MSFVMNNVITSHRVANAGFLPEEGQVQIKHLLGRYRVNIPNDWDWNWIAEKKKGMYVGSLTKRLSKLLYKTTDNDADYLQSVSLGNDAMGRLGSLLGNYMTVGAADYHFRFVDTWHERRGDFGENSGNCYFGMYKGSRTLLEHYKCKVLQFFAEPTIDSQHDQSGREVYRNGIGRAWLLPVRQTPSGLVRVCGRKQADLWVLCNGYGLNTVECCRVLADYWNMTYRRSGVSNEPITGNYPWVNAGAGYLIGPSEVIHRLSEAPSLKLNMPEGRDFNNDDSTMYQRLLCAVCGHSTMSWSLGGRIFFRAETDDHICYDCRTYGRCSECNQSLRIFDPTPTCWSSMGMCDDCYADALVADESAEMEADDEG